MSDIGPSKYHINRLVEERGEEGEVKRGDRDIS
jgi:hypothetical protein